MKPSSFVPLLLLLLIFFLTSIVVSNSRVPAFNRYILALHFTKSLCNHQVYSKRDPKWNTNIPKEFTIHGCGTMIGNFNNTTPHGGMYQSWVDAHVIYTPAAYHFRKWEWDEHGQYTYLSILEYFKTTYDLFTDVGDVRELFKREGLILPSRYINLTDDTTSLECGIGAGPFLKCITNTFNEEFLWEVDLLFSRASLSILNHYRTDWDVPGARRLLVLGCNNEKDIMY
ncbi:hypothetical protein MKW98_025102 [Papaver atlanticum]|uniref:Uncharacterized protein n=1 Tax=Papaver atlanticum TaxID=357466 RepID=A0AAD4X7H2_9MAGN|nr:hypothetical protein MKW98_025102 [Papaver atlanticum]